jgi:hypothetical protein
MTTTAAALAEPQAVPMTGTGNPMIRDVTVSGCVAPASQPNVYVLDVTADRNASAAPAAAIAPGTPLRLVGLPPEDFQDYIGQQVEVFGMLMPHGSSKGRGAVVGAVTKAKLGVRYIRQLAVTCSAPAVPAVSASAVPAVPGKNTDVAMNRGGGKSGSARRFAVPATATPTTTPATGAQPVNTSTPGLPAGYVPGSRPTTNATAPTATPTTGAQPVSNTSPAFLGPPVSNSTTGTAPSNSTTSNAGLGQSGVSGSASLGGGFSWSTPTLVLPVGGSAPGPTSSPAPGSTTTPVPGSTQLTAPGSTTLPLDAAPGFAQGASNTTTTNAALDQFGLSGDALLSGLVNVNVQQLLASVQVQANLNVQDVIVNLSDILNDNQIQALVQALNTNPQAALNANDLSSALQTSGLLDPSQWVVGVTGSQIYANRSLTDALQSRGIIQPTETIMGTATPHVYVVQPGGGGQ